MSCSIGLRAPTGSRRTGRGPRLQDFRHSFATRRLVAWYRAGLDVGRELPKLATYLGHVDVGHTYWYIEAVPELLQLATERLGGSSARRGTMTVSSLQSLIQRFFTDRLLKQLGASPYTVAAYRDAFRLLLQFGCKRLGRSPSKLLTEDLDVPFTGTVSPTPRTSTVATARGRETTVWLQSMPSSNT
jgi:hypothetical protein